MSLNGPDTVKNRTRERRLIEFARKTIERSFRAGSVDAAEIQEFAKIAGLIERRTVDARTIGRLAHILPDLEVGDTYLKFSDDLED